MTAIVKAIPTFAYGCRFRSRLEAKWATFFTAMNIEWHYELEGYELPHGRYLPDFLLPSCGTWVEVKGPVARLDQARMVDAAKHLPTLHNGAAPLGPALIILGSIPPLADGECIDLAWLGLDRRGRIGRYSFAGFKDRIKTFTPRRAGGLSDLWLTPDVYVSTTRVITIAATGTAYKKARAFPPATPRRRRR